MLDIEQILLVGGYVGLFLIIFAESGVFAGFFLPGDSLLVTAGLLASQGYFNIVVIAILCTAAAIAGDSFGYSFGKWMGPRIFTKEESLFFHKKYIYKAEQFFDKYGKRAIIIARFIPAVRTFTPIFAGVGKMPYRTFLAYNVVGAIIWATGLTVVSYVVAKTVPGFEHYFEYVIAGIIILSFVPIFWQYAKSKLLTKG